MSFFLFLLAIAPSLIISCYVYWRDRNDRESYRSLLSCFILGMLVTIPAIKVEQLENFLPHDGVQLTFWGLFISTFGLVAIGEEFFKALPLLLFAFPKKYFNEPFDGIIFSVMVAMGFATVENVFYAYQMGMQTTLIRAFTAVPAHAALAIIIGYHVGLAKFDPERKYQLIGMGFLQAVLVHGLYDFFIIQEYDENWMGIAALVLTLSIYYAIVLIRRHSSSKS